MDSKLLAEKASEIEIMLTTWAHNEKLLQPGEQIVFTLSVRATPTVVQEQVEDYRNMHPFQFFTKKRMIELGVSPLNATRVANGMLYTSGWNRFGKMSHDSNRHYLTVGEFLTDFGNRPFVTNVAHGSKVYKELMIALKVAGFDIT